MIFTSFSFFIITKTISDCHHFCKWKFLQSILQVTTSVAIMQILKFYCNYVGGTFCYFYVGGSFCCSYEGDWLFVLQLCSNKHLEHLCRQKFLQQIYGWQFLLKFCNWQSLLQSCRWYFLQCIMHMITSILILQVAVSIVAMYVTASSSNCIFLSNWHSFFIKLTRQHLKALYQVCISPL